jgi:hypothetical protein
MRYSRWMGLVFLLWLSGCRASNAPHELAIASGVDQFEGPNVRIIAALRAFLASKDQSPSENPYWLPADFKTYQYPYLDIYQVGMQDDSGNFLQPTLIDIVETDSTTQRIVKLGYLRQAADPAANVMVYKVIANLSGPKVLFSRYTDYATRAWANYEIGSIRYVISPHRKLDSLAVRRQGEDIDRLCAFLEATPIHLTYFSCTDPLELFQIKGFDYHPKMYWAKTGGLAEHANMIYSGGNSEYYTHEITHLYTRAQFPQLHGLLDEGFATFVGGSSGRSYLWHRTRLKDYLAARPSLNLADCLDPYSRLYTEDDTPLSYMVGALLCERALRMGGRDKLYDLFLTEGELPASLERVGLDILQLDAALRADILLDGIDFHAFRH